MNYKCNLPATRGRSRISRIIVCGIGTGGHYFPAIVVAQALQRRAVDVIFLVRSGHQEEKVAHEFGLKTFSIDARPYYGKPLVGKMLFILSLVCAIYRLHVLTSQAIALAFGGFGAVPLLLSCMINRSAYYIFEPNRVPGRATRRFASGAKRIFLGLPSILELKDSPLVTGIPVRKEFKERPSDVGRGKKAKTVNVLFYGGSQGARRLNDLALELPTLLPKNWHFTIISGTHDYERVSRQKGLQTRVLPFTENPWEEIRAADVIVSRAGALAGYEILCLEKRVIFVPFPYATDNHQYYNAEYFARVGEAVVLEEENLTGELLSRQLCELYRKKVHRSARVVKDAEEKIVDVVLGDIANEEI
jgi:UDP-N-acetylglucosamine--N-acetylmuramyl-(pentapeptide) pyrophosphoryl-undecaprenol N-acetylglucosamine transferase